MVKDKIYRVTTSSVGRTTPTSGDAFKVTVMAPDSKTAINKAVLHIAENRDNDVVTLVERAKCESVDTSNGIIDYTVYIED